MTRPKADKRLISVATRRRPDKRGSYQKYGDVKVLKQALLMVVRGKSVREVATKMKIPRSTLGREYNKFKEGDFTEVDEYLEQRTSWLVLLTPNEEDAVEKYALWQQKRGMPLIPKQIKALIREIHAQAIEEVKKDNRLIWRMGHQQIICNYFIRDIQI